MAQMRHVVAGRGRGRAAVLGWSSCMQQGFRYCVLWLASGRGSLVTGQSKVAQVSLP